MPIDGKTSSVVKSSSQNQPSSNTVSKGNFQSTSQSHQGQRLSYQGSPVASALGKSSQFHTFARPTENKRPAAPNPGKNKNDTLTFSVECIVHFRDGKFNLLNTKTPEIL